MQRVLFEFCVFIKISWESRWFFYIKLSHSWIWWIIDTIDQRLEAFTSIRSSRKVSVLEKCHFYFNIQNTFINRPFVQCQRFVYQRDCFYFGSINTNANYFEKPQSIERETSMLLTLLQGWQMENFDCCKNSLIDISWAFKNIG